MRAAFLSAITLASACQALPTEMADPEQRFGDPRGNIEIRYLGSRDNLSEYQLRNTSSHPILYFHWAGQGPEPAAYCERIDLSVYICSETAYVEGNDEVGFEEWIHETVLEPRETISFKVRSPGPTKVGVKFPISREALEVILWSSES